MDEREASLAQRLGPKLHRLFVALILACVVAGGFRPVMDQADLGWHVAQGRWMVEHGAIYREDLFNYPYLHHPIIDEYPLFQVVLYAFWSLGWWGPCLLTALAWALLIGLLLRAGRRSPRPNSPLLALALGAMLLFLQVASPLRPHLVTYLGVTAFGIFLLRHREPVNGAVFWPLALVQIAWVNCHSGFVLGPAMIALFGGERVLRRWIAEATLPWSAVRTWGGALLLICAACFINPYGWNRFYLPFYQDQLESIRAYVGEMEPLRGGPAALCQKLTLVSVVLVALAVVLRRGELAWSFLIFAIFFYLEAQSAQKAWPILGLFVPLLVLSADAGSPKQAAIFDAKHPARLSVEWLQVFALFFMVALAAFALFRELDPALPTSVSAKWLELDLDHSELSRSAVTWMKAHQIEGRLFHRCEDGGWLQQEGYDHGETFADTGFGKYDEAFIHEVGLVNERPALLPRWLQTYQPDFVVCSTFCEHWPWHLRREGWRLLFFSPNSSVWTRPNLRADLPTITVAEVETAFQNEIAAHGRPADLRLYGRSLITLHSMGLEDFVFAEMRALPPDLHRSPWYWEAARSICFTDPPASLEHRNAFFNEAKRSTNQALTAEFRAYACEAADDPDGALLILEPIPLNQLSPAVAELRLKMEVERKRPEALALARRSGIFDLRNGHHWQYLAQAEERAGNSASAAAAWEKAVFYFPDDAALMRAAADFATRTQNQDLQNAITESGIRLGSDAQR